MLLFLRFLVTLCPHAMAYSKTSSMPPYSSTGASSVRMVSWQGSNFGNAELLVGGISQVFVFIYLLEEIGADGQSQRGSLPVRHAVEMDVAVFAAHPTTGGKRRREAYEPTVGVPVGGSRLASHVCVDMVTENACVRPYLRSLRLAA